MIKFYVGKSSTGKSHQMMKELKKSNADELIYLVPEQFNLEAERQLIEKMGLPGLININVLSFDWLIKTVLKSIGGINGIELDRFGQSMIIRKILGTYENDLVFYKGSVNKKGLIDKFNLLFQKINMKGVEENSLKNIFLDQVEDDYLKKKTKDILKIYQVYRNYLTQEYLTVDDQFKHVLDVIDSLDFLKNTRLWIDEFHGFNALQFQMIEKIFSLCEDVTIALTIDYEHREITPNKNVNETLKKLEEICVENNFNYEIIEFKDNNYNHEEIYFLSENIFKYPNEIYSKEVINIKGFIGNDFYSEVEMVAIELHDLIKKAEYTWQDIAIIVSSLDDYQLTIKSVLEEYNIPYFIDKKVSILNNPLIKFIISTLEVYQKHFRYEDVFSLVKTGFTHLSKNESEKLENYVINYGIKGSLWQNDFKRGRKDLSEDELKYINSLRKKLMDPFFEFYDSIDKKINDVSKFTISYYEFLKEYGLVNALEEWIRQLQAEDLLEEVNENTQIWNIIMKIIEEFVELFKEESLSLKEYIKILKEGITEYEVGILPALDNEVLVGDVHRTKVSDIKVLCVLGMNDGLFPSKIENNDIFSEDEKMIIKKNGFDLQNDLDYKVSEENYLVYRLFSKAKEHLILSYALSNNEGKTLRPSIFIDKIKSIFPEIRFLSFLNFENEMEKRLLVTEQSTVKYLVSQLRKLIDGYPVNSFWLEVYQWYLDNKENFNWIEEALFYDNNLKSIDENFARKLYELPLYASSSRIDSFVDCPFKHFVKYGLSPKERKNFEVELPDLGIMFHASLEEFGYALEKENIKWEDLTQEKSDAIVSHIVDEITSEYNDELFNENNRNKYYKHKILRVVKQSIWTLIDHVIKGDFKPKAFEINFSDGPDGLKPVIIDLKNSEKLILKGTIDRLDILERDDETYVRVIDYKSGASDLKLSDIYNGNKTQLMIYLDALINDANYFGFGNIKPAGVYYFKIDDPIVDYETNQLLQERILDEMKLSGIGIKDLDVLSQMDHDLVEKKKSSVFDVKLTKNGDFYSNAKVITDEDFYLLRKHVKKHIENVGNKIISGDTNIFPLKKSTEFTACSYCDYLGICQFDQQFSGNHYNVLPRYKDKEVIEKLHEYETK
jgi:ATP-dependent helicase/nuclease subunit B